MAADLVIDGRAFADHAGFVDEFNRAYSLLFGGPLWDGESFDDLDDFLDVDPPITVHWVHSVDSREKLGYEAMSDYWKARLERCRERHPEWAWMHDEYRRSIEEASNGRGRTLFEYLCWQMEGPNCLIAME